MKHTCSTSLVWIISFLFANAEIVQTTIGGIKYSLDSEDHTAIVISQDNNSIGSDITIPETVTYQNSAYEVVALANSCFQACTNLRKISLPNSVTSIGDKAFSDCFELTSVTNQSTTPQQISSSVFQGVKLPSTTLYVPIDTYSRYASADGWSTFGTIAEIIQTVDYKETYPRRMVVEEGTGTWCGWCVRGIVAMDYMKEQYPDNFIGIAIHSSDKMDFSDEYGLYFEFYPGAYYNRSYYGSVSQTVFLNQIQNSGLTTDKRVVISQIEPVADGIRVETKARVAKDISDVDYRLIYVITEDNVGPYNQNNAYAGGGNGAMGGFENMGSPVSLIYNDVARSIYPDNQGLPGSVPSVLQSFTDYVYEAVVPLPDNYSDYENLSLTVMLYDVESGEILNADRQKLTAEIQGDDDVPDSDDQALSLVLHLRSGKKIAYQLDEQPVVTFDENNIVIETLKGAIRYNATDALKFTYINTEDSGIDNVEMPDYFISVVENAILARGLEPGTEMSVYSTDGLLVASKTVDLNGEASVLLPDLKGKVYLVKTSVTTFKIVMK